MIRMMVFVLKPSNSIFCSDKSALRPNVKRWFSSLTNLFTNHNIQTKEDFKTNESPEFRKPKPILRQEKNQRDTKYRKSEIFSQNSKIFNHRKNNNNENRRGSFYEFYKQTDIMKNQDYNEHKSREYVKKEYHIIKIENFYPKNININEILKEKAFFMNDIVFEE